MEIEKLPFSPNHIKVCEKCHKEPVFTHLFGIGWLCLECYREERDKKYGRKRNKINGKHTT